MNKREMQKFEISDDGDFWFVAEDFTMEDAAEQYVRDLFAEEYCSDTGSFDYDFQIREKGSDRAYEVRGYVEVTVDFRVTIK